MWNLEDITYHENCAAFHLFAWENETNGELEEIRFFSSTMIF